MEKPNIVTIIKPSQFNKERTRIKCAVCKEELPLERFDDFNILRAHQRELEIEYECLEGVSLYPIAEKLIASSAVCNKDECKFESKRAVVEFLAYHSMLKWDSVVEWEKEFEEERKAKIRNSFKQMSEPIQLDHLPKKAGIYLILFFPTGEFYIGKAINVHKRANEHLRQLRQGRHNNTLLQKYFDEYGESAFSFLLLEGCDPKKLDEREYYWLKRANVHQTNMSFNVKLVEKLRIEK